MVGRTCGGLGNCDFDRIAFCVRELFVEGFDTVTLLEQATSEQEKETALIIMPNSAK